MSYHPGDRTSGMRWRDDTGIERRCSYCPAPARWWPLTEEFWDFRKSFVRCRACLQVQKRKLNYERLMRDAVAKAKSDAYHRRYKAEAREVISLKNRARYWSDPETERAKSRAYYERNREAILEKARLRYWSKKFGEEAA